LIPLQIRHNHGLPQRGKLPHHVCHARQRVDRLAGVGVAVGREQHGRRDLPEAVQHAAHAEIRRARGPDRAETGRSEHGNDGLGRVGQEAADAVARAYAGAAEGDLAAGDLVAQRAVG
jgi:hypothetical protein